MISHSAPASSATAIVVAEDRWIVGGAPVWWRLGRAPDARGAAHAWVEDIVRRETPWPWRGIARTNPRAKPRLAGDTDLDFSLSHSGEFVLVAVAQGVAIGADIETAPFRAFGSAALRRRMLAPAEEHLGDAPDDPSARAALARVWTAKEAFVKATGEGLSRDFRTFRAPHGSSVRTTPDAAAIACLCALAEAQHPVFLPLDSAA